VLDAVERTGQLKESPRVKSKCAGRLNRIIVAFVLLTTPLNAAVAQQPGKVPRVGFLTAFSPSDYPIWREGFRQGLRDLGYTEGQNIVVAYRYANGRPERLPSLAAELVRLRMDIIAAETTPANLAVKQATTTIPIVMTLVADPVFPASPAREGTSPA
jgi:ABC-type uncharacterized transport system substrate-binding protein